MIGLPLEENYRATRIMPWTTGLEDLQGLILDSGWKLIASLANPDSYVRRGYYKELDMVTILLCY